MHRDQPGAKAGGAAAGTGHGGGDVVKLEVEEHLQAPLAQLGHHGGPGGTEEFEAHLHPAQRRDGTDQGEGGGGIGPIQGQDDSLGRVRGWGGGGRRKHGRRAAGMALGTVGAGGAGGSGSGRHAGAAWISQRNQNELPELPRAACGSNGELGVESRSLCQWHEPEAAGGTPGRAAAGTGRERSMETSGGLPAGSPQGCTGPWVT